MRDWLVISIILFASLTIERYMGRSTWPSKYTNILWTGSTTSAETSQVIADPYTFTHVLHGIVFAWFGLSLPMAVGLESLWEIFENTQYTINRYRSQTASIGYEGDTILNSGADIGAMMLGWAFCKAVPWWISALVFVVVELVTLKLYRDNLTLLVMMLIAPNESIKQWQLRA